MLNLIYNKEYSNDRQLVNKKKIPKNSLLSALISPTRKMANTELSDPYPQSLLSHSDFNLRDYLARKRVFCYAG